jgi:Protein of unknown function (DUF2752)
MPSKIIPPKTTALFSPVFFAVAVLGATAVGAGAMVYFFNPSAHGFYPVCLFHSLTGLNCPGCGMTRALYALLHGNFRLALKDNALFVFTLAALMVWGARFAWLKSRNRPARCSLPPKILWTFFVIMLLFGLIRNLPGFDWLSP